ncbi:hypothetical protein B0H14DRAFT_3503307 [Mycena olivaceomarginata]|nr:hypothetical protein B0H14DRAFT_3503307 [Mycena olivaceomarginata]
MFQKLSILVISVYIALAQATTSMCCNSVVGLTSPLLLAIPGILQLIPQGYGGNVGLGCSPVPASGVCPESKLDCLQFISEIVGNDVVICST